MVLDAKHAAILQAYADTLDVHDYGRTSEFAARYRYLKAGTTEKPGLWSNEHFPVLTDCMDVVDEAIDTGKKGVVLMKAAQGGGSEAMINSLSKNKAKFSGPILYIISKDEVAYEFSRDRFGYILDTCTPLRRKSLRGKANGESLMHKRFIDGKIDICSGRSVLNLQSQPYRFVYLDEVDSLAASISGQGDPVKIAQTRMDAYSGETLMVAFAHPTTKEHGAGKLYYDLSDQRRGFVTCPHCEGEFWLDWDTCVQVIPADGLNREQAEYHPEYYFLVCPKCGVICNEADRLLMIRKVRQKSTLPPEEAAKKSWIGVHFSQLYYPQKTIRELAIGHISGLRKEDDEKVFRNKVLGDVYEPKIAKVETSDWKRCVVIPGTPDPKLGRDPHAYAKGEVPPGVQFLTAGHDSRETELHYAVWGWGNVRNQAHGHPELCGWAITWGVFKRPKSPILDASELHVLDGPLYQTLYPATWNSEVTLRVSEGGHDCGWAGQNNAAMIAVNEYCRQLWPLATPTRGAAETMSSSSRHPMVVPGRPAQYVYGGIQVRDDRVRPLLVNTFSLKDMFFGLVDKQIIRSTTANGVTVTDTRLHLPVDTDDEFLSHLSAEQKVAHGRKGELIWKATRANHWLDCSLIALAMALNRDCASLLPFGEEEQQAIKAAGEVKESEDEDDHSHDPLMA